MQKTLYLRASSGLPAAAIIVGDPSRIDLFAQRLKENRIIPTYHGWKAIVGHFNDLPLAVVGFGMGAPAVAVLLEELAALGVKIVVRAGTAMALACSLKDFILAEGAVRLEGVSTWYLPLPFPAIPDTELFRVFESSLLNTDLSWVKGLIVSMDALSPLRLLEAKADIDKYQRAGAVGLDMETAALYVVSKAIGLRALSLCLASVQFGSFEGLSDSVRQVYEKKLVDITLQSICYFTRG